MAPDAVKGQGKYSGKGELRHYKKEKIKRGPKGRVNFIILDI